MSILVDTARPWGPFAVGFGLGVLGVVYGFVHALYLRPPNLQHAWEYDGIIETYVARWRFYDWRYSVLVGGPFVVGAVVWLVWFVLSLIAGV